MLKQVKAEFLLLMLALLYFHEKTCLFILIVFMVMSRVMAVHCLFSGRGKPMLPWTAHVNMLQVN